MFHISFLVRDKHLADTLRALSDKVMNLEVRPAKLEEPEPVKAPRLNPKTGGTRKSIQIELIQALTKLEAPFTTKDLQDIVGCSDSAAYKFLTRAVERGELTKIKRGKVLAFSFPKQPDLTALKGVLTNAS